jgi:hypothetical protein
MSRFIELHRDDDVCPICGVQFAVTAAEAAIDRAIADLVGGRLGETCDDCSEVIVNGSPDDIDELMRRNGK